MTLSADVVSRREFFDDFDVRGEARASERPLEQVMAQQSRVRGPAREGALERIEIVDALAGVRPLAEHVLIDVRNSRGIGINPAGAREYALKQRALAALGQRRRHPRLKHRVAFHDSAALRVDARPIERMRHLADQPPDRVARQSRVQIQREDVSDVLRRRRRGGAEIHEGGVRRAAQQPIQLVKFAALAFPTDPSPFTVVPDAPAVQQEKTRACRGRAVTSVEALYAFAGKSEQLRVDADTEHTDGDAELLAFAREGIEGLNRRYGPAPAGPRFLLLHRRRVWNDSERRWIGWERKRGKLHELNRLLRGATDTTFMDFGAAAAPPPQNVRYVLTLDSDTRLPRDTVRRLIGKMAHPLNRPRIDAERGRVVEGYAVLQPRVTPSLPEGGEGSLFQRIFSSASGIDPYSSAVSDVYQDMFGEGSYAGKGIYDLDAFESALSGRAPDSTLLSHDLFEGTFARAGFASEVEVVEEFPSRYDVSAQRHHRWARGDWQLLPWILGFASRGDGAPSVKDELPRIGRWKMIDNLRRTLSAPTAVLALALGWTLPIYPALVWTSFVLATMIVPSLIPVISAIPSRRPGRDFGAFARAQRGPWPGGGIDGLERDVPGRPDASDERRDLAHAMAAFRQSAALARMGARRSDVGATASRPRGLCRAHVGRDLYRARGLLVALLFGHGAWPIAAPFVALWLVSPAVARAVSVPRTSRAGRTPPQPTCWRCGERPAARGGSSRSWSARRTIGCLPTIFRKTRAGGGPSHFADQPRTVSAVRRQRPRLRLDRREPSHRAPGGDVGDDDPYAAFPRPLLQLVRHPRSPGPRAQVCFLRRQRQSGRPPHRGRQRLPGMAAIVDARRIASGWNRRRARADRRAGR